MRSEQIEDLEHALRLNPDLGEVMSEAANGRARRAYRGVLTGLRVSFAIFRILGNLVEGGSRKRGLPG